MSPKIAFSLACSINNKLWNCQVLREATLPSFRRTASGSAFTPQASLRRFQWTAVLQLLSATRRSSVLLLVEGVGEKMETYWLRFSFPAVFSAFPPMVAQRHNVLRN